MSFLDNVAKRFGFQKIKQKGTRVPWDSLPEIPTFAPALDESPPDWKATDYLKASKSWVYACVSAIADEVASINFRLYKKTGKKMEEIFDHDLLDVLYRVNDFTTKFDHFWLTQDYLELAGEAPWALERNGKESQPTAMYLLRPDRLKIKFDKEKIIGKYIYSVGGGKEVEFEKEDVIFLKYPNPLKPFRGMGTLEAAIKTVDLDKYAEEWNVRFFFNSARPDAILTTEKTLTSDQREFLKKQWDKNYRGIGKRAKMAILEGGLSYTQMQIKQKDMDFIEQQRFSRDKILSIFRVPKSIIAITDDVNRANAETQAYAFARWTIKPKMTRIVEQLNEFLVPMFGDDLILDFDDPVPENLELKIKQYRAALSPRSGWLTINEVRVMENLPPVDNGDSVIRISSGREESIEGEEGGESDGEKMYTFRVKKNKKVKEEYLRKLVRLKARNMKKKKIKDIASALKSVARYHLTEVFRGQKVEKKKKEEKIEKNIEEVLKKQKAKTKLEKEGKQMIKDKKDFWKKHIRIQEKQEKKMIIKLEDLFDEQEKEVIKKLRASTKAIDLKTMTHENRYNKYWYEMKINIVAVLLAIKRETEKFYVTLKPILKETLMDIGEFVSNEIGSDVEFTENKAIREYLDKNTIRFSKDVNVKTNEALRKTLAEGIIAKESINKLTKRVENVFAQAKGYRAQRIARTETARTANFATVESYRQSGVVAGKQWLTAFDERTCEWCVPMNGKIVSLEEDFFKKGDVFVGRDGGKLPLDYTNVGYPPLHVNCRCTLVSILVETEKDNKIKLTQNSTQKSRSSKNKDKKIKS